MDYLLELDATKKEEYRKEKEIVDGKIAEAERKMEDFTSKKRPDCGGFFRRPDRPQKPRFKAIKIAR